MVDANDWVATIPAKGNYLYIIGSCPGLAPSLSVYVRRCGLARYYIYVYYINYTVYTGLYIYILDSIDDEWEQPMFVKG